MPQHITNTYVSHFVKNVSTAAEDSGWALSDTLSVVAILISLLTIAFSYYSIYKTKIVEIKFEKFSKACLENINVILKPVDELFENQSTQLISSQLPSITDHLLNIELFISELSVLYSAPELETISIFKDDFTDFLYSHPGLDLKSVSYKYLAFKSELLFHLYEFAIKTDADSFKWFKELKRKIFN